MTGHQTADQPPVMSVRTGSKRFRAAVAALVAMMFVVLAGCSSDSGSHPSTAGTPEGRGSLPASTSSGSRPTQGSAAAVARTSATAVGSNQNVTVSPAALTPAESSALSQGWSDQVTLNIGIPVQVSTDSPLPPGGVRLTRTYAHPLPSGVSATMAYYDPTWGSWRAVPSTVADDRRSVTAVVHHLSLWTDINGAVGAASSSAAKSLGDAADWGYYQIGKNFDTRVHPPTCTGKPSWLRSSIFIRTDRNNPLNFCVGSDPKNTSLLDVKVNVNRGYSFNARINSKTAWQYNSTFQGQSLHDVISAVGHLDQDISKTWDLFVPPGSILVEPGKELSFGATNQQVAAMGNNPTVLSLAKPTSLSFMVSTLGQLVGTQMQLMADGYVAAVVAVAGCYSDVVDATTSGAWVRAAVTCLGNLDEAAARNLATYLTKRGASPKEAGVKAGSLMGRIGIYLALVGPVFSTMNFLGEQATPQSARTVDVYPSVDAGANTFNLRPDGSIADSSGSVMPTSSLSAVRDWLSARLGKPSSEQSLSDCGSATTATYFSWGTQQDWAVSWAAPELSANRPHVMVASTPRFNLRVAGVGRGSSRSSVEAIPGVVSRTSEALPGAPDYTVPGYSGDSPGASGSVGIWMDGNHVSQVTNFCWMS